jgi:hypothetical protein
MPIIPATQEAEVRRIEAWSQLGQVVCKTLSQTKTKTNPSQKKKKKKTQKTHHKNRAGGVAQGEGPEFKPSTAKRKKSGLWPQFMK